MTPVAVPRLELGEKIRRLRRQAGLTLKDLSRNSGVGLGTVSRMENGKGGNTVETHQRIAQALGLSLADLYQDTAPLGSAAALAEGRPEEAETFTYDAKASSILLATQVMSKHMLPQLLTLQPGGTTHTEQTKPGCERFVFVLGGRLEVRVGEQRYPLKKYGTLYFKASLPHALHNPGKETATCLSVTSPVGW